MPDLITIAFIGLAGLGLALFWRGWRGRRIDDHPQCRRCGFDLFGSPRDSARCPECGASLDAPRAVQFGRRKRRPVVISLGTLFVALALTWFGILASGLLANFNWNRCKPAWWLAIEARSADAAAFAPALIELHARMERGELAPDRIRTLSQWALDAFALTPTAWPGEWNDFVQRAWTLDHLDDQAKVRFAQSMFEPEVYIQPATLNGETAALIVNRIDVNRPLKGMTFYRCRIASLTANGEPVVLPEGESPGRSLSAPSSRSHVLSPLLPVQPGEAMRVVAGVEWRVGTHLTMHAGAPRSKGAVWETLHSFNESDLRSDLPVVELVNDERTRQHLIDSLRIQFCAIRRDGESPVQGAGSIIHHDPPVGMQAEITLRAGDRVVAQGGDFTMEPPQEGGGSSGGGKTFTLELPDEEVALLDLVFEPRWYYMPASSRRGASRRPLRFWYGELRITDLPVQWFEDANDERISPGIRSMLTARR